MHAQLPASAAACCCLGVGADERIGTLSLLPVVGRRFLEMYRNIIKIVQIKLYPHAFLGLESIPPGGLILFKTVRSTSFDDQNDRRLDNG